MARAAVTRAALLALLCALALLLLLSAAPSAAHPQQQQQQQPQRIAVSDDEEEDDDVVEETELSAAASLSYPNRFSDLRTGSGLLRFASAHPYEMLALVLFVAYVANFFVGRRQNRAIAQRWLQQQRNLMRGLYPLATDARSSLRSSENAAFWEEYGHVYRLGLAGNSRTFGAVVTLQLQRRHDLLFRLVDLASACADRVLIETFVNQLEPMIVAVGPARSEKEIRASYEDVRTLTDRCTLASVVPAADAAIAGYTVFCDHRESAQHMLTGALVKTLVGAPKLLHLFHVTDRNEESKHKQVVRFAYTLRAETAAEFGAVGLQLHERAISYRPSPAARKQIDKVRQQLRAEEQRKLHTQRQESSQKRKEEKMKKKHEEQQEMLKRLAPAQRAKMEAKIEREKEAKELKKLQKMQTIRV